MFWDKGYTPSQNIEALLEKENTTVEEFLDDEDILQECKSLKKSIVNYFTRPDVINRLVEYITTEPSDELPMAQRFRHANMSCEILTLGLPSLDEKLLSDADTLKTLYSFLEKEPPLNPLLSSFFSKTFSMLFSKKAEQDWFLYQQMCLKLLEYIKLQNNFLDLICKHFATPIIPDLIMTMMRDVEGSQLKRNLYEWLTEDRLVERLIALLGNPQESDKHANVAEFLCDLIQQGRSMRQTEQENDSFEPAFDGSNPILKCIESVATIDALLNVILQPNAHESAIVSGITVVLTLIKPVVFVDEPHSDRLKLIQFREKDIHEEILATVISVIAPRLRELNELLSNPPKQPDIVTTAAKLTPPFGITRLQICRLFTELLQTNNEKIANAICETDFFDTLLMLFRQYSWNNFLHSEVEKCLHLVFYTQPVQNNSTQGSTIVNDGSFGRANESLLQSESAAAFFNCFKSDGNGMTYGNGNGNVSGAVSAVTIVHNDANNYKNSGDGPRNDPVLMMEEGITVFSAENDEIVIDIVADKDGNVSETVETTKTPDVENNDNNLEGDTNASATSAATVAAVVADVAAEASPASVASTSVIDEQTVGIVVNDVNDNDGNTVAHIKDAGEGAGAPNLEVKPSESETTLKDDNDVDANTIPVDNTPSPLQTHVIVKCKSISKLIDCWQHNKNLESAERGRRLGYMGHLIKIFKHISNCISEYEHIGALIENSLRDAAEVELWQSIINPNDGDFTKAFALQNRFLANCDAHEVNDYTNHLPKDFNNDNSTWDDFMASNMISNMVSFNDGSLNDIVSAIEQQLIRTDDRIFGDDDDLDDDDEAMTAREGISIFNKSASRSVSALQTFGVTNNPWDSCDPFKNPTTTSTATPWAADFGSDNFADFDSHFSSFSTDLGQSLIAANQDNAGSTSGAAGGDSGNGSGNGSGSGDGSGNGGAEHSDDLSFAIALQSAIKVRGSAGSLYDNNANVDKSTGLLLSPTTSIEFGNFDDIDDEDEGNMDMVQSLVHSLVHSLHTVTQDSEDDYEDDEGMWTRPLGTSAGETALATAEDEIMEQDDDNDNKQETFEERMESPNSPSTPNLKMPTVSSVTNQTTESNIDTLVSGSAIANGPSNKEKNDFNAKPEALTNASENITTNNASKHPTDDKNMTNITATDITVAKPDNINEIGDNDASEQPANAETLQHIASKSFALDALAEAAAERIATEMKAALISIAGPPAASPTAAAPIATADTVGTIATAADAPSPSPTPAPSADSAPAKT